MGIGFMGRDQRRIKKLLNDLKEVIEE